LYLSLYLKQHRSLYYDLLQQVRTQGAWEEWLSFFLEGIVVASKQAMKTAERINKLFEMDLLKIATLGRGAPSCQTIFEFIKRLPQVSVSLLSKQLKISAPTARNALNNMVTLGVLVEVSGKLRDKIYVYRAYLDILEEGAAPL
jgi:Fic family protein